jgi:predicted nucleic acid-binding Zn ribbon protein
MEEISTEKPVKYCLECGKPIGASREDKKYCSNECRTAYNNERRKQLNPESNPDPLTILAEQREFKSVYDILLKNRQILYLHNIYFGDELPLRDLLGKGFNMKYFTSVFTDENGFEHRSCFDYGYYLNADQKVYIIHCPEEIWN